LGGSGGFRIFLLEALDQVATLLQQSEGTWVFDDDDDAQEQGHINDALQIAVADPFLRPNNKY